METGWTVIVADEMGITRRAVAHAIRNDSEANRVLECSSADSALSLLEQMEATLMLVDLKAPGLELVAAARERQPGLRIVVVAGYDQPVDALHALQAGADGFLVKGMYPEELLTCLRCVVDTGVVVMSRVVKTALTDVAEPEPAPAPGSMQHAAAPMQVDPEVVELLTPREREIFDLMAGNCSNKEIASQLHIAEQTVKAHVSRILFKLGEPNRAQAVIHGFRGRQPDGKVLHLRRPSR
jgi:two-component system, NarL family, response regulator LiaR